MTAFRQLLRRSLVHTSMTFAFVSGLNGTATAQPQRHPLYQSQSPTGMTGAIQVRAGRVNPGYVQPVQVSATGGALVSVADGGSFQRDSLDLRVGLIVGQVYRLRISQIPQHEEQTLYPSVELIDHLHPPEGQRDRFPIPIEFTREDLEVAMSGSLVVRVIYVEDPQQALPLAQGKEQLTTDVLSSEDPLSVADAAGRPIAIVRLGSRTPAENAVDEAFTFGSPAVEYLAELPPPPLLQPNAEQVPAPVMMRTPLSVKKPTAPRVPAAVVPQPSEPPTTSGGQATGPVAPSEIDEPTTAEDPFLDEEPKP